MPRDEERAGDAMSETVQKTWKDLKAERDADANSKLHRCFALKPEFSHPGCEFTDTGGRKYRIAQDGSWRRIKS